MPTQGWFADDSQAVGRLRQLLRWWKKLLAMGPRFGYTVNLLKCFLVVKPHLMAEAGRIFKGTGVKVVAGGKRDLGAAVGTPVFVEKFLKSKVGEWEGKIEKLAVIARTQPHAALASFTHGLSGLWTYSQRTMRELGELLQPLENAIRQKLLPKFFGEDARPFSDDMRALCALPARNGGLGISNPMADAAQCHEDSLELTEKLRGRISASERELGLDDEQQAACKRAIRNKRRARQDAEAERIMGVAGQRQQRAMQLAQEKGASALFTALPLDRYGFALKVKQDFTDLVRMRYCLPIKNLPDTCPCGSRYSLEHSQQCTTGGFISGRHDDVKRLFAGIVKEAYRDVGVEPGLLPLSGEVMRLKSANVSDEARSDVRVRGFWGNKRDAFFDVAVFYPFASSYLPKKIPNLYATIEKAKQREYKQRVNEVEDADFIPLVMSSTGGMGKHMQIAIKHLAETIAERRKENYSKVVALLRAKFVFCVARAALVCLRGSRSIRPMRGCGERLEEVDLACAELCL